MVVFYSSYLAWRGLSYGARLGRQPTSNWKFFGSLTTAIFSSTATLIFLLYILHCGNVSCADTARSTDCFYHNIADTVTMTMTSCHPNPPPTSLFFRAAFLSLTCSKVWFVKVLLFFFPVLTNFFLSTKQVPSTVQIAQWIIFQNLKGGRISRL